MAFRFADCSSQATPQGGGGQFSDVQRLTLTLVTMCIGCVAALRRLWPRVGKFDRTSTTVQGPAVAYSQQ
eukprot:3284210-Rhodomonas_salina.1